MMTTKECKPSSLNDLFQTQFDEMKQIKIDLENIRNELSAVQTKYHQQLTDYEIKLEQLYSYAKQIEEEQEEKQTNLMNATAEWNEIKSKLESTAISPKQKVKLNVGGEYYETTIETLTKCSSEETMSYFKALFSRQWQLDKDPKDDSIFVDRDGVLFGYILQYLRTGKTAVDRMDDLLRQDLIIEAEFYKIPTLITLLNRNQSRQESNSNATQQPDSNSLYSGSMILSFDDQKELNKLSGYDNQQWQLLYRASRDGYTAKDFHRLCDGCFPTMCIIRSKNKCIFGGFTSIPWSSKKQDNTDTSAFLFTLKNPHGIKPTKYPIRDRAVDFAISHHRNDGPTFGSVRYSGLDLSLQSPFNGNDNRTFFPQSYEDTTKKNRYTFTNDPYFSCDEVEIFTLI